jgi:ABC-type phosphate transport system auxiliary subunit
MKSIVRITQRLVSLFLVLIASGMMFLSSPAIAATSSATTLSLVNITDENYQTEVIQSSKIKPVIVIVAPKNSDSSAIEKVKTEAENFYGDKYKIVTGTTEENKWVSDNYVSSIVFPPPPTILGFKNSEFVGASLIDSDGITEAFDRIKEQLGKVS